MEITDEYENNRRDMSMEITAGALMAGIKWR